MDTYGSLGRHWTDSSSDNSSSSSEMDSSSDDGLFDSGSDDDEAPPYKRQRAAPATMVATDPSWKDKPIVLRFGDPNCSYTNFKVADMVVSPGGTMAAIACSNYESSIILFHVPTGRVVVRITSPWDVTSLAFTYDDRTLVAVGDRELCTYNIPVWGQSGARVGDTELASCRTTMEPSRFTIRSVACAPNGQFLLYTTKKSMVLLDAVTLMPLAKIVLKQGFIFASFDATVADTFWIVNTRGPQRVRIVDVSESCHRRKLALALLPIKYVPLVVLPTFGKTVDLLDACYLPSGHVYIVSRQRASSMGNQQPLHITTVAVDGTSVHHQTLPCEGGMAKLSRRSPLLFVNERRSGLRHHQWDSMFKHGDWMVRVYHLATPPAHTSPSLVSTVPLPKDAKLLTSDVEGRFVLVATEWTMFVLPSGSGNQPAEQPETEIKRRRRRRRRNGARTVEADGDSVGELCVPARRPTMTLPTALFTPVPGAVSTLTDHDGLVSTLRYALVFHNTHNHDGAPMTVYQSRDEGGHRTRVVRLAALPSAHCDTANERSTDEADLGAQVVIASIDGTGRICFWRYYPTAKEAEGFFDDHVDINNCGTVVDMTCSPDGSLLAVLHHRRGSGGFVTLIDTVEPTVICSHPTCEEHEGVVCRECEKKTLIARSLQFSARGDKLLAGSRLWSLEEMLHDYRHPTRVHASDTCCSVCFEEWTTLRNRGMLLPCHQANGQDDAVRHVLCRNCVSQLPANGSDAKRQCPLCRAPFAEALPCCVVAAEENVANDDGCYTPFRCFALACREALGCKAAAEKTLEVTTRRVVAAWASLSDGDQVSFAQFVESLPHQDVATITTWPRWSALQSSLMAK